jgi:hypothetical protein
MISANASLRFLLVTLLFCFAVASIVAQETTTPTPAPSKTATPLPTFTATDTPEEDADADAEDGAVDANDEDAPAVVERAQGQALPRAFTQEDLSVMTANVLRPNGILWFNDYLWTACTGDWTLYRVADTTGETITFVGGVRNSHTLYAEGTSDDFDLFVPDYETNSLVLTNQNRVRPRTVAEGLDGPWGIAYQDEAHFLITNLLGNNIMQVSREGDTEVMMEGLRAPAGLVLDGDFGYVVNNGSARRAIEWFDASDLPDAEAQPLVSGLQNASGLVLASDGYLYFTYALGTRGVVGRVNPLECRDGGCSNDQVEIVVYTELPAPLAGLTISDDMRLYVHAIFQPQIYWVPLYD